MNEHRPLTRVLVTDCGSTTTKAILFERTADGWRQAARGEAPTTVEEPIADVTVGARNAFAEVEEVSGIRLLNSDAKEGAVPLLPLNGEKEGVDIYLSTSSAGGGLQMVVSGVVGDISTQSAERAALGAGAIVLDSLSADDGREEHERIQRVRHLKPDIVLMTGGTDGGTSSQVIEQAELLLAAAPRPRFGDTLKLPVIYAGNKDLAGEIGEILKRVADIIVTDNVRPTLTRENLAPARDAIHELFLTHVMSHAPGYGTLISWSPKPIMPTPAAVGDIVSMFANEDKVSVLAVDIGGATTDVFSVFPNEAGENKFHRTVSANLGMSYSVANVLVSAGVEAIRRWLPYFLDVSELRDRLRNKMIRPTTIPQTREDLLLEQAVCREALRLSLEHHKSLAIDVGGFDEDRGIGKIFSQKKTKVELVSMNKLDVVIGSGGVLSHAPHRLAAALMMLDGFELQGVTHVLVDSIFMMPHLGVLRTIDPGAAAQILRRECLVNVCHAVVPIYAVQKSGARELAKMSFNGKVVGSIVSGEVRVHRLEEGSRGALTVKPLHKDVDMGAGPGVPVTKQIVAGMYGILADGRNRPLVHSKVESERVAQQRSVIETLGI